jgi:hypothetical protein
MYHLAAFDSVDIITRAGRKGKEGTRMENGEWRGEVEDEVMRADGKRDKVLKAY